MKTRHAIYVASTVAFVVAMLAAGASSLMGMPESREVMARLGYPAYVATLLGFWKILGALAIAVPRLPRLKEWAYAGFFFDFTGAAWSHFSAGDSARAVAFPLVFLLIGALSWALRPAARKVGPPVHRAQGSPYVDPHAVPTPAHLVPQF